MTCFYGLNIIDTYKSLWNCLIVTMVMIHIKPLYRSASHFSRSLSRSFFFSHFYYKGGRNYTNGNMILVKIAIEIQILFVHNKTTVKVALLLAIFPCMKKYIQFEVYVRLY